MIKTIDIAKTTDKELAELIRQFARQNGDQCLLQEDDEPLAALISQADYERYTEQERQKAAADLRNFLKEIHAKIPQDMTEEEVDKEIIAAIHEMRGVKC